MQRCPYSILSLCRQELFIQNVFYMSDYVLLNQYLSGMHCIVWRGEREERLPDEWLGGWPPVFSTQLRSSRSRLSLHRLLQRQDQWWAGFHQVVACWTYHRASSQLVGTAKNGSSTAKRSQNWASTTEVGKELFSPTLADDSHHVKVHCHRAVVETVLRKVRPL